MGTRVANDLMWSAVASNVLFVVDLMTPDVQWAEMTSISENADIVVQMISNDISTPAYHY